MGHQKDKGDGKRQVAGYVFRTGSATAASHSICPPMLMPSAKKERKEKKREQTSKYMSPRVPRQRRDKKKKKSSFALRAAVRVDVGKGRREARYTSLLASVWGAPDARCDAIRAPVSARERGDSSSRLTTPSRPSATGLAPASAQTPGQGKGGMALAP